MATPARGMSSRALQAEHTREQILQTAQRLFVERGYDATSLQMIADELGLTKAAVYYHFRVKSELLHAAMKPGIERIAALVDEAAAIRGRRARIEHVVNGVADFLVENRRYSVMAANDPATKRQHMDKESIELRERALTLFYGDNPSPAERLAYHALAGIPDSLADLVELSDEELRQALRTTMLRILRVPSQATRRS
jgi:AcrR family transcriptional regulator